MVRVDSVGRCDSGGNGCGSLRQESHCTVDLDCPIVSQVIMRRVPQAWDYYRTLLDSSKICRYSPALCFTKIPQIPQKSCYEGLQLLNCFVGTCQIPRADRFDKDARHAGLQYQSDISLLGFNRQRLFFCSLNFFIVFGSNHFLRRW